MRSPYLTGVVACAVLGGCDPDRFDPYERQAEAQANLPANCRYRDRPVPLDSIPGYWCDDNQYGIPGDWGTGPVVTPEGELLDPIVIHEDENSRETVSLDLEVFSGYTGFGESIYLEVFGDQRASEGVYLKSSMSWGPGLEPMTWTFEIGPTERREGFTMACEEWEDPPFLSPNQGWARVLMCDVPYIHQGRVAFIPARELWE